MAASSPSPISDEFLHSFVQGVQDEMMIAMLDAVQKAAAACATVCVQRLEAMHQQLTERGDSFVHEQTAPASASLPEQLPRADASTDSCQVQSVGDNARETHARATPLTSAQSADGAVAFDERCHAGCIDNNAHKQDVLATTTSPAPLTVSQERVNEGEGDATERLKEPAGRTQSFAMDVGDDELPEQLAVQGDWEAFAGEQPWQASDREREPCEDGSLCPASDACPYAAFDAPAAVADADKPPAPEHWRWGSSSSSLYPGAHEATCDSWLGAPSPGGPRESACMALPSCEDDWEEFPPGASQPAATEESGGLPIARGLPQSFGARQSFY